MKTAHTPGPWLLDQIERGGDLVSDGYHFIEAGKGFHNGDDENGFCISGCMSLANARLIAAAPCLLAAHEADRDGPDFLDWVAARLIRQGDNPNSDFILCLRRRAQAARAAIAKARGAA